MPCSLRIQFGEAPLDTNDRLSGLDRGKAVWEIIERLRIAFEGELVTISQNHEDGGGLICG